MALSCIISEIKRDICRKSRFFHTPCIRRPRYGVPVGILMLKKTRILRLYLKAKKSEDTVTRFDTIRERDGQHNRQTDRQTLHDGIGRAYVRHKWTAEKKLELNVLSWFKSVAVLPCEIWMFNCTANFFKSSGAKSFSYCQCLPDTFKLCSRACGDHTACVHNKLTVSTEHAEK